MVVVWLAPISLAAEPPQPRNTQHPQDVLSTPQQALAAIQLPPAFSATLFAHEPQVQNPIHFTFDAQGRIWVAENYTYAEREVGFAADHRDRIVVLEDQDGDGRCDRRKVFYDRADKLTSVAVGFGGVWALCAPKLLFIPDRDGDDVPDGEPVVVLDGWNDSTIRHNIVNGLTWGPDGWLYGRHGILATSLVGKPGTPDAERTPINCGVWRYHPTRQVFEAVAHGTTNPWGLDFDDHGQMFFSNTVIGHLWHVVPGAHYERMYGVDLKPHRYGLMSQCADHFHWDSAEQWSDIRQGMSDRTSQLGGGHAHCGLMIYLGDNWPAEYRNSMLTINLHGQRINRDVHERQGAGYVARHAADLIRFGDRWFRGIELAYGPDGGVYVADWSDVGECHENDGVHRTSGRIYKITHGRAERRGPADLTTLADSELVQLQTHANDWYVRQARRLLQERAAMGGAGKDARAELLKLYETASDVRHKLRALWSLYSIGAIDEAWLRKQLIHPEEHLRVWAVRLLADRDETMTSTAIAQLEQLARRESSGLVRLFVASALQRMPQADRFSVAIALAEREDDAERNLALLIWYGIEPAAVNHADLSIQLAARSRMGLLRRHVARRLTEEIESGAARIETLLELAASDRSDAFKADILGGMADALEGWQKAPQPQRWQTLAPALLGSRDESVRSAAQELAVVFGDGRGLEAIEKLAADPLGDVASRRQAVRVLVEKRVAGLAPLLHRLLGDRALFPEAVRGLAAVDHPQTPRKIMEQYARFDTRTRDDAIATLCSRLEYARVLLDQLEQGRIAPRDVSAWHVRQILSFNDPQLRDRLTKAWGEIRDSSTERKQQIASFKQALTAQSIESADLPNGRLLFNKHCANCHVLYGQGAKVGPDLTGANRQNLDYLLENIVDPSATVATNFRASLIELKDGRIVTGVVLEQNDRTLSVQTQREAIRLARSEVEQIAAQSLSLMPDGLLNPLSADETRDLVAYLSGRAQVELPPAETAASSQE
jgi:putative membrane-bound dehydrogenase-like protein